MKIANLFMFDEISYKEIKKGYTDYSQLDPDIYDHNENIAAKIIGQKETEDGIWLIVDRKMRNNLVFGFGYDGNKLMEVWLLPIDNRSINMIDKMAFKDLGD